MKKIKLLLCMLSLASLGVLTACDDDDDSGSGSGGGGGDTNDAVAPASLSGKTMNVTVNSGTVPFAESGEYSITFTGGETEGQGTYVLNDFEGGEVSTGSYEYFTDGTSNTATLIMQDSVLGTVESDLTFDSESSGTIESTATNEDGSTGNESGTFTLQ